MNQKIKQSVKVTVTKRKKEEKEIAN